MTADQKVGPRHVTRLSAGGDHLPDAPHRGLVINLAEQRLYYFPPGKDTVET
jgi:hypothetical protein